MMKKRIALASALVAVSLAATACNKDASKADRADKRVSDNIQQQFQTNQPVPQASRSQLRGNLIDILKFQTEGGSSWSYFFGLGTGSGKPLYSCPSIGDPIPITDQLTNPEKTAGRNSSSTAIGQMEPTGVFTGDSAGTNVICLGAGGEPYKLYWEGFVMASSVELIWDGSAMVPKPGGGVSEHKFTGKK